MKTVLTAAVMDLCHDGHLNLLRRMRKEAGPNGCVVVILHDDKSIFETKGKIPVQSLTRRIENLQTTGLVDVIMKTYDHAPRKEFLEVIKNARERKDDLVFMRGDDWFNFPGRDVLDENKIPIKLIPYTKDITSTKLRKWLLE